MNILSSSVLVPVLALPAQEVPSSSAVVVRALEQVDRARLEADVRALAACGTRHPLSPVDDPVRGVGAARNYLRAELAKCVAASQGRARLREVAFDRKLGRGSEAVGHFVNFVLEVPGSDPTRGVWVVSGHYDSRNKDAHDGTRDAPGADDDASGTAVALELARVLSARSEPLPASVWLCAFDGEEHGLFGSDHLAEEMKSAGLAVEGMVTNDIVGGGETVASKVQHVVLQETGVARAGAAATLRCFSEPFTAGAEDDPYFRVVSGESDGASRQLARYADRVCDRYVADLDLLLILRRDRFGRGGDHESFNKRGFAAIRFTEPDEDYRHQHEDVRVEDGIQFGDLVEFVDFAQLARVARLNLAVAMEGASAPPPPPRVHLGGAVRPHATLEWTAVGGDAVAGYRVFARRTDASEWQTSPSNFVPAGATTFEHPLYTVDDWHFGVATVGKDGSESPVRFPTARPRGNR